MKARVNRIIPFSSVDGPGNRTAIFFQGCNFNCLYCHNPETIHLCNNCGLCVNGCPTGALRIEGGKITYDRSLCCFCDQCIKICPHGSCPRITEMTPEEVMAEVKKQVPFIRGITTSGGECTLHKEFLKELFPLAQACGLTTFIDSNGSLDFSKEPELMSVTDSVMLDIKAFSGEDHHKVTGRDNDMVLQNAHYLASIGKLYEVRTVVSPGLYDCEQTIRETARMLAPYLKNTEIRYKMIKYRPMGVRENNKAQLRTPGNAYMEELKSIAIAEGFRDVVLT